MFALSEHLLQQTIAIAQQAGEHLMNFYQRAEVAVEIKSDNTPVTEVDLFLSQFLIEKLTAVSPNIPVLSEEQSDIPLSERAQWARYWLIDPLDGTKQFINRTGNFSILIALMERDANGQPRPILSVIEAPVSGKTYYAMKGFGAYKMEQNRSQRLLPRSFAGQTLRIAVGSHSEKPKVQAILKKFFAEFVILGSSGLKGALVAEGLADCYVRLGNTSEWDTAAAELLLAEMGGKVMNTQFAPLTYNQRESLVNPHFVMVADGQLDWTTIFQFN